MDIFSDDKWKQHAKEFECYAYKIEKCNEMDISEYSELSQEIPKLFVKNEPIKIHFSGKTKQEPMSIDSMKNMNNMNNINDMNDGTNSDIVYQKSRLVKGSKVCSFFVDNENKTVEDLETFLEEIKFNNTNTPAPILSYGLFDDDDDDKKLIMKILWEWYNNTYQQEAEQETVCILFYF